MRLLLIGAILVHVSSFAVEPQRPPSGKSVDERREVALRTEVSKPCLAFQIIGATVMLQKSDLEELVGAVQEDPAAADSQMLELNRHRARSLLEGEFSESEINGCLLARNIAPNGEWVLLRQLELGEAAVVADGTSKFAPRVFVRYYGVGGKYGGGRISVLLPGMQRAIYSLPWWIR